MKLLSTKHRGLSYMTLASFLGLVILMLTTSPIDNILYAAFFFALAFVFLVSLGHFFVRVQIGKVSPKNRYRIVTLSLILLIFIMFRSAQSLNWVDGLILLLIGFGLVFYISRRS